MACQNGHKEIVELLLQNGTDVNQASKKGFTPLHIACQNGNKGIVELLLQKGAEINQASKKGFTPLLIACQNGHKEVVRAIISYNLNKNDQIEKKIEDAKKLLQSFNHNQSITYTEYMQILKEEFVKSLISPNHLLLADERVFPKSLFIAKTSSKQASPHALLNVSSAVGNKKPFQSLTSPSEKLPNKKNIILDKDSFSKYEFQVTSKKQIIEYLVKNGFDVYLCICKEGKDKLSTESDLNSKYQDLEQDFIHLNFTPNKEIDRLLKQPLKEHSLNESSLATLTKFKPSISGDNIVTLDINESLTVLGLSFVSGDQQFDEFDEKDHNLFRTIDQKQIELVAGILEKKPTVLTRALDFRYTTKNQKTFVTSSAFIILVSFVVLNALSNQKNQTNPTNLNQTNLDTSLTPTLSELYRSIPNIFKIYLTHIIAYISSGNVNTLFQSKPKATGIYVTPDGDSTAIDDKNGTDVTYNMKNVGEILSSKIKNLKTRTGVGKATFRSGELMINKLQPSEINFTRVDITSIKDSDIDKYKTEQNAAYVKFTSNLKAGLRQRLYSIDAQERLVGVLNDATGLVIEKGDDGFFYATSNKDRELSYVLDGRENMALFGLEEMLPDGNPIQEIINDYKDPNKGFKMAVGANFVMPQIQDGNIQAWKREVYDKRLGSCRHRVAVVYDKIIELYPDQKENVRISYINGNHVVLEVRADSKSKWIECDLGGSAGNLSYEKEDKATIIESIKSNYYFIKMVKALNESTDPQYLKTILSVIASSATIRYLKRYLDQQKNIRKEQSKSNDSDHYLDKSDIKFEITEEIEASIEKSLKDKTQPHEVTNIEDLSIQVTIDKLASQKTLLVNKNHKDIALLTIAKLKKDGFETDKIFYLNNPDQVFRASHLNINKAQKVKILPNSKFKEFLKNHDNSTIIIDWAAFSNKEILALNTILDKEPSFEGQKISSPSIISIAREIPNDHSFISRHNKCLKISDDLDIKSAIHDIDNSKASEIDHISASQADLNQAITIDLQGFTDWRQKLFGYIALNKNKIEWHKSGFCQKLEKGYRNFKIINISRVARQEFEQELKLAKSFGFYDYFGRKLPSDFKVDLVENNLDFSQFFKEETQEADQSKTLKINRKERATLTNIPDNCQIINSNNFDFLLKRKNIKEGVYYEEAGLISDHKDTQLNLFLTSELSDQQYYCLCEEALKHNVTLNLYLAESVKLPSSIKTTDNLSQTITSDINSDKPQIFVSNNPQIALQEILQQHKDLYAIIDVEDYNYPQLFEETTFKMDKDYFKDFAQIQSEFYNKLKEGKKIILKGEFSDNLLEILHPILCGRDPYIKDNLILLIEDEQISKKKEKPSYLNFLGTSGYEVKHYDSLEPNKKDPEFLVDTTHQNDSTQFINQRKEALAKILEEDSLVEIVGHSGVGKTELVKRLEEDSKRDYAVYNEIANFEKWANDKTDQIKILFIDESNIEDSHLTKFSPLKDNELKDGTKNFVRLLHNKKFYELGKNHKVIFARNPENYSTSRNEQKLFDQDVKTLYLSDFPSCYIYKEILKAPIYDQLPQKTKKAISIEDFKEKCDQTITAYQDFNEQKRQEKDDVNCKTVRELQEEILNFVHGKISIKDLKLFQEFEIEEETLGTKTIDSKNFISTDATKELETTLRTSIQIRGMQKKGILGISATGLNGLIIQGSPGIGKSEMIRAILEEEEISEATIGQDEEINKSQRKYYKIDAGAPTDQIKKTIIKAYEEGNIVWIDEINSCIDNGDLEKILNAALTGKHPEGASKETKPGFMLISSINPPILSGRSQLSPAIKHRATIIHAPPLNKYQTEDLTKICQNIVKHLSYSRISEEEMQLIVRKFEEKLSSKEGVNLNLRDLTDIIEQYNSKKEASIFKKNIGNPTSFAEQVLSRRRTVTQQSSFEFQVT